jgi:cell division protein FtsW
MVILLISLIGFLILINVNTKNYGKLALGIFLMVLFLNLSLVLQGVSTRGAQNWINLGFFKLQPSELAKPTLIICLSLLFEKYFKKLKNKEEKHDSMIWKIMFIGLIFPVIVFLQKDLGTAIILLGIFVCLFLFSPISKKEKINVSMIVGVIGIVAAFSFLAITGYLLSNAQMSRFNYFNPCSKYTSTGYQVCNAFIAINNGGLTGVGLGKSTQKYSYIPEPHTDMVFSIIAEENGVIICTFIFIAYLIILFRILKLSMKVKKISHRYMCLGFATYIFLHILINLGGLFGLIPLTGVPLPFLSYGGSFTISLIASVAVIERIHIEMRNERIKI